MFTFRAAFWQSLVICHLSFVICKFAATFANEEDQ